MQLLLNEKDICISAKNNLIYDDEKKLIDYINDHFVWLSSTKSLLKISLSEYYRCSNRPKRVVCHSQFISVTATKVLLERQMASHKIVLH